MANSNSKITAPVNVLADVKKTLGVSTGSIVAQCQNGHKKINKHAYYKPYKFGGLFPNRSIWAQTIKDNNFGMTPKWINLGTNGPTYSHTVGTTAVSTNDPTWLQWQPPTGGMEGPQRPGDFNGYNANARPHINSLTITGLVNASAGGKSGTYPCFVPTSNGSGRNITVTLTMDPTAEIKIGDFHSPDGAAIPFSNQYLTAIIMPNVSGGGNWSDGIVAQSVNPISSASTHAVIIDTHLTATQWSAMSVNSRKVILLVFLHPKIAKCHDSSGNAVTVVASAAGLTSVSPLSLKMYPEITEFTQVMYFNHCWWGESDGIVTKPVQYRFVVTELTGVGYIDVAFDRDSQQLVFSYRSSTTTIARFTQNTPSNIKDNPPSLQVEFAFSQSKPSASASAAGSFAWSGWIAESNGIYAASQDATDNGPTPRSEYYGALTSGQSYNVWVRVSLIGYSVQTSTAYETYVFTSNNPASGNIADAQTARSDWFLAGTIQG